MKIPLIPPPKILPELKKRANTYAVSLGDGTYGYYPCRLSKVVTGNFGSFEVLPNVVADGYVSFNRRLYHVSVFNLLRRKFDVRNYTNIRSLTTPDSDSSGRGSTASSALESIENQQGIGDTPRSEEDTVIDMDWEEQISALFDHKD